MPTKPHGLRSPATWLISVIAASIVWSCPTISQAQPAEQLPGAEPEVRVLPQGTVEMHVSELPLSTVLQLLSIESERNIVASPGVTGTVTASLYNVTFEEALDAVLASNGAGYREVGKFIYVYSNEELAEMAAAADPPITKVFRLSYVTAADAKEYITPLIGDAGTIATSPKAELGIGSGSDNAGGDSTSNHDFVIVTAPQRLIDLVEDVLAELDVRPQQVLVEATILRAELTDDNELGIDFTIVGGVDLEMLGATSTGLQNLTLGNLPTDQLSELTNIASTDFRGNVSPGGLSIGILKDNVAFFVRALEQVTDTAVLANPKVLALNKQKGQVIVGRRDGYLTTTVTETQSVQAVEFLETGTQLIFRPFIGNDGFVRMELHPEDSVGLVNAQGLPSEQTTEVTTNVMVEDGHTVLIGGLFREVSTNARQQVPGLGGLPWVGPLFRSQDDSTAREEVIILLTVHIVKDNRLYSKESDRIIENIERMRVGIRKSMMWTSQDRIARMYYRKALEAYSDGNDGKAMWNLKLALHSDNRFMPAVLLREKISGERLSDNEGSTVRGFLYQLMSRHKGIETPRFDRPAPPFLREEELRGPKGFVEQSP